MQVNPPPPPQSGPGAPGQPTFGFPGPPGTGFPGQPGTGFPGQVGPGFPGQAPWQGTGFTPVPAAPKPRMRKGWIIGGVVLCVLGVLMAIGGAITMAVSTVASSIDPEGQAVTPASISFVAEAKEYDIVLTRGRREDFREASDMNCTVVLADGSERFIDGDVQAVSVQVGKSESVGSFDAVAGPTVVTCDADGGNVTYVVKEASGLVDIGLVIVLVGIGMLVLGTAMILLGVFWKKQPVGA